MGHNRLRLRLVQRGVSFVWKEPSDRFQLMPEFVQEDQSANVILDPKPADQGPSRGRSVEESTVLVEEDVTLVESRCVSWDLHDVVRRGVECRLPHASVELATGVLLQSRTRDTQSLLESLGRLVGPGVTNRGGACRTSIGISRSRGATRRVSGCGSSSTAQCESTDARASSSP